MYNVHTPKAIKSASKYKPCRSKSVPTIKYDRAARSYKRFILGHFKMLICRSSLSCQVNQHDEDVVVETKGKLHHIMG